MFAEAGHQVEVSVLARLEEQFRNINHAILRRNAHLICWWSRDLVVVNVRLPKGHEIGYAEHLYSLQALLQANQSITTGESYFFGYPEGVVEGRDTWLDGIIKHCAKVRAKRADGEVDVSVEQFIEQYLHVPYDRRVETYREGEMIWNERGYVYRLTPWPHGKTGQDLPVGLDLIEVLPEAKPRKLGDEYYHLRFHGRGPSFLTALAAATRDSGTEFEE